MIKNLALIVLMSVSFIANGQNMNLRINELVASNSAGMMDDFFETDDWVEIYNPPGSAITNLAGYYLSDDPDSLDKWQIPNTNAGVTTVLPNNFIVFWIDNDGNQGEDHVGNFTLSADGEMFILTAPDATTIIDSITFGQQGTDVSYGRVCDGCATWQFFNNVTFSDNNAEMQTTDLLFVNEVQAAQSNYYNDLQGEFDPWFEIYNPNTNQVNLANYTISVAGNAAWTVPNNNPYRTVIPPGGFMLVWCDGDVQDDTNHAPIMLNTAGGIIELSGPNSAAVDNYTYPSVPNNQSYGRQNDGSASSIIFAQPTPTVTNSLVFVQPQNLFINELMAANQSGVEDNAGELEDWFEIYNPNNFDVNIGGYYFSDNAEVPTKWIVPTSFPDSVIVPANGWLLFWADDDEEQGVLHTNFRLSNNGEYLGFFSPDGFSVVDEIAWAYIAPDTSLGRITDGAQQWVYFSGPTPEASNNQGTINIEESNTSEPFAFPNPTANMLYLMQSMNLKIYSTTGALLQNLNNTNMVDTSEWPAGIYIATTASGQTMRIIKL